MRLAVDAGLGSSRYGGLGGYVMRIVRGLAATPGFEVSALVPAHNLGRNEIGDLPGDSRVIPVEVGRPELDFYDRRVYWEQEVLPSVLSEGGYDAYFGPTLLLPLAWPGPKVVAIHDLAFEAAPDLNTPRSTAFYQKWAKPSAQAAAGIAAISHTTARDLDQLWGIADTVTVTHLAPCLEFVPADREESRRAVSATLDISGPYALNVGGDFPRKNLSRLLDAVPLASKFRREHTLVLVIPYRPEDMTELVRRRELQDCVKVVGYCPPELLPHLFSAADFFVYPSLFEGFGLPPLEAMQCGTPVAVSDRDPFREVLGADNALYFDPTDPGSMADALDRLTADRDLRDQLAAGGPSRAARYSWESTVRDTSELIARVA